jgi:hypothetical protein
MFHISLATDHWDYHNSDREPRVEDWLLAVASAIIVSLKISKFSGRGSFTRKFPPPFFLVSIKNSSWREAYKGREFAHKRRRRSRAS